MIAHKTWREPKLASDGVRLLAMAHYPRGAKKDICDVWMPELAPEPDDLKAYHHDEIPWQTLIRRYKAKLKEPAQKHLMQLLASISRSHGTNVTVMCGCENAEYCHRTTLAAAIEASFRSLD